MAINVARMALNTEAQPLRPHAQGTSALLDRITHHVHILEMNGDSYRLKQSRSRRDTATDRAASSA